VFANHLTARRAWNDLDFENHLTVAEGMDNHRFDARA
jgi:hypothetical protein